ncbi:synthesizing protein 2/3/4 [Seminavis robusta]|uniref:tRNA(Phe) (4-demethylwyosine(37)-C(7)) aminocarboxypropyltransferase n=1 Tax=Seminavis robusta TaxID=568900 RepID=A0A9N8DN64_9STRA|nr:synthesizing protein 2/3/4 [Seminavis robusta]|eukprot:Sro172_g076120.1 synthesizing protein 2/3/4 (557) ;mRNA; f:96426-98096
MKDNHMSRSTSTASSGDDVQVIFVPKKNAKTVKTALEGHGWIHKDFRMTAAITEQHVDCLAIPVLSAYFESSSSSSLQQEDYTWKDLIVGHGRQHCPFSTSVLGNRHKRQTLLVVIESKEQQWSPLQQALLAALQSRFPQHDNNDTKDWRDQIDSLSTTTCPAKVEFLGDDNNLVLPPKAMLSCDLELSFFKNDNNNNLQLLFMDHHLWPTVARTFGCPRILRKGGVDPNSRIRQTGYQLLWPPHDGTCSTSGPDLSHNKKNWITVTEQGIRQSFDVTQVMFSRGNISEKIRFGTKLVQEGDVLLDLYAGIGYYTLPALVHGKASHVYACEWNPHAVACLRYNLRDNHVHECVDVMEGDCRNLVLPNNNKPVIINRVSLGLLPSSQGGWRIAVQAVMGVLPVVENDTSTTTLNSNGGGWLHVHGNVPVKERDLWAAWLVRSLHNLVLQETTQNRHDDWVVICHHVEKVKSFAPTVNHFVADVFVGPREKARKCAHPQHATTTANELEQSLLGGENCCYVYDSTGIQFVACSADVVAPSCALTPDGPLHQEWMRGTD